MEIWIFQSGEPLHIDSGNPRPMRAMNLANALLDAGHNVVLWSSAFYHQEKRHRFTRYKVIRVSEKLEIRLIPSMGYKKNVGFGRLLDHAQLALRLKKILKKEVECPDVVFIGYPPIETAAVLSRWCKKRKIPTLLDVKDLWPSMFLDALPDVLRPFGRVVFAPYFYVAKKAMREATGLTAMADAFLARSLDFSEREKTGSDGVFPLTSPSSKTSRYDLCLARKWWNDIDVVQDERMFRVFFVGSFMSVYDFSPIQHAAQLAEKDNLPVQFILCGSGGSFDDIKAMMKGLSNVVFPGWIDRSKIESLAQMSNASLAPYRNIDNFVVNITNKIVDALSLGLPILSPLQGEVANLISTYHVGLRYGTDTDKTLYDCICTLMHDHELQQEMSKNGEALYAEKFSFDRVYGSLVAHLEKMATASI